jgi:DNA uptake protein ComE-like DNA-binding protein
MVNFTPEERKVTLFILSLALCGLILNNLMKINCRVSAAVYPQVELAKLNLNQVGLSQLKQSKCVPVKVAQQIFEYRNLDQGFRSWEEVKEIKGVGGKRFDKLQEIFFIE